MMRTAAALQFAVGLVAGATPDHWPLRAPHADGVPASFDCAMRQLAYAYGKQLAPRQGKFESLFYALGLNDPACKADLSGEVEAHPTRAVPRTPLPPVDVAGAVLVSPGDSIQDAVDRACRENNNNPTVLLRDGVHYLDATLVLTPAHSGLTIAPYPGEEATVSGGKALDVTWEPYNTSDGANVWVADVQGQVADVPGLQLDGVRATRARYPNLPAGIEASCGYGCMVASNQADWTPPDFNKYGNVTFYTDAFPEHDRNDTANAW